MGREKKDIRQPTAAPAGEQKRKRYTKPQLKRLGTVRELTQTHPSVSTR